MRAIILMVCCAAMLTACRSAKSAEQQTEYQCIETHDVHVVDSVHLITLLHVDSVEIAIVRPDSTRVYIRAKGVKSGQHRAETHDFVSLDTLQVNASAHTKKEVAVRQPPSLAKATLMLIFLIILTFTICKLCKH